MYIHLSHYVYQTDFESISAQKYVRSKICRFNNYRYSGALFVITVPLDHRVYKSLAKLSFCQKLLKCEQFFLNPGTYHCHWRTNFPQIPTHHLLFKWKKVSSRFLEGLVFPKLSERFRKFRNHLVYFNNLHRVWDQKFHITDKIYLKWHYWTESIRKNYIAERTIAETFGYFQTIILRENGQYMQGVPKVLQHHIFHVFCLHS